MNKRMMNDGFKINNKGSLKSYTYPKLKKQKSNVLSRTWYEKLPFPYPDI